MPMVAFPGPNGNVDVYHPFEMSEMNSTANEITDLLILCSVYRILDSWTICIGQQVQSGIPSYANCVNSTLWQSKTWKEQASNGACSGICSLIGWKLLFQLTTIGLKWIMTHRKKGKQLRTLLNVCALRWTIALVCSPVKAGIICSVGMLLLDSIKRSQKWQSCINK